MVLSLVHTRVINSRTIQQATFDERWAKDIQESHSFQALMQMMHLRLAITMVQRDQNVEDVFAWPCAASATYSACSTYLRLCLGLISFPQAHAIWRSWAPLKCKIFSWLATQKRLWTFDRCAHHGLQDEPSICYTCLQDEDNVEYILAQCVYARETWHRCFDMLHLPITLLEVDSSFLEWWLEQRLRFWKEERRGFDSLVTCAAWLLWEQKNARVFNRPEQQVVAIVLASNILDEIKEWRSARNGVGGLQHFVRV